MKIDKHIYIYAYNDIYHLHDTLNALFKFNRKFKYVFVYNNIIYTILFNKYNRVHNLNGPAIISCYRKYFYIDGRHYSDEELYQHDVRYIGEKGYGDI